MYGDWDRFFIRLFPDLGIHVPFSYSYLFFSLLKIYLINETPREIEIDFKINFSPYIKFYPKLDIGIRIRLRMLTRHVNEWVFFSWRSKPFVSIPSRRYWRWNAFLFARVCLLSFLQSGVNLPWSPFHPPMLVGFRSYILIHAPPAGNGQRMARARVQLDNNIMSFLH